MHQFGCAFKLGTILHGPGRLRFYGLFILQADYFSCPVNADKKLQSIKAYLITRTRCLIIRNEVNALKRTASMFVNSSLSWLGTTVSPLCAFYLSHLQQMYPLRKMQALTFQINALRLLKKYGTVGHYPYPNHDASVGIVAFLDARHISKGSQLCFIIDLVYGNIFKDSVFHLLYWTSYNSRCTLWSTPAAVILAASGALDSLIPLRSALQQILGTKRVRHWRWWIVRIFTGH